MLTDMHFLPRSSNIYILFQGTEMQADGIKLNLGDEGERPDKEEHKDMSRMEETDGENRTIEDNTWRVMRLTLDWAFFIVYVLLVIALLLFMFVEVL